MRNVERWIWLLAGGGALVFVALVVALHVLYPETPPSELVDWPTAWLFALPAGMAGMGVYTSVRWWRCPYCGRRLRAKAPVPDACPGCRRALVEATASAEPTRPRGP